MSSASVRAMSPTISDILKVFQPRSPDINAHMNVGAVPKSRMSSEVHILAKKHHWDLSEGPEDAPLLKLS